MKKAYLELFDWYKELPWYWKILGSVVLVLIAVLAVLALLPDRNGKVLQQIDELHEEQVNNELKVLTEEETKIRAAIIDRKLEMAQKVTEVKEHEEDAKERRMEIVKATTMDDLDKLQEKYGL